MKHVLIVEDDSSVAEMMQLTLEHAGYTVVTIPSAEGAIEAIETHNPVLAIVDVVLPGQGGMDLVLDIHAKFKDLPLILTSGKIDMSKETFKVLAKQFGVVSILAKPFTVEELMETAAAALAPSKK